MTVTDWYFGYVRELIKPGKVISANDLPDDLRTQAGNKLGPAFRYGVYWGELKRLPNQIQSTSPNSNARWISQYECI